MALNLIKEFTNIQPSKGAVQADLGSSDGSMAGQNDVKTDVRFSMMRNIINRDGGVTGSDVQDYLERAHDLNDEIDTVAFGVETDDNETIKIYVNAAQADEFEAEMSNLLGMEDDAEAAINTLAQKYDIVDVVWPDEPTDGEDGEGEEELDIEDDLDLGDDDVPADDAPADEPSEGDAPPPDEQADDVGAGGPEGPAEDDEVSDEETSDEEDTAEVDDESTEGDEEAESEESDEDDMEPVLDDDGEPVLDADGNPKMRKKKKAKADDETTGENEMKQEGIKLSGLAKLAESKRKDPGTWHNFAGAGKVYVPGSDKDEAERDLHDALDNKANGADEVTYKGKKYKRSGPKNATSQAGKWKLVKESYEPEEGGLGSRFLDRVIVSEAAGEEMEMSDTVLKGLRSRLKKPYEKKCVELMSLCGVLGRYVDDVDGLGDGTRAGADGLRRGGRVQRAFNAFYDGMKNLSSGGVAPVAEAKKGSMTLKRLVSVLAQFGLPASSAEEGGALSTALRRTANKIDKNADVESSLVAMTRALGLTTGEVNESKDRAEIGKKQKAFCDELFAAVKPYLRKNGYDSYRVGTQDEGIAITVGSPTGKGTADQKKLQSKVKADLKPLLDKAANGRKYSMAESPVGFELIVRAPMGSVTESQLDEAFPEANDAFIEAAVNMMKVLGLPQANLDFRGTQAFQALRAKRQSLNGPAQIANRLNRLAAMIEDAVRTKPGQDVKEGGSARSTGNFRLNEAFSELEALTASDMKQYNVEEPAAGPAMFASYQGSGNHEDTVLVVGVDPEAESDRRSLKVSIANPWDGVPHSKAFENTKEGYSDAVKYANMLRSANLRTGGRPRGWKD